MDLEQEDLVETAKNIISIRGKAKNSEDFESSKNFNVVSEMFSKSYSEFRKMQEIHFVHPNYHTLRDFYWMIKIFADCFYEGNANDRKLFEFVRTSIDTNFSGLYQKKVKMISRAKSMFEISEVSDVNGSQKFQSNHLMKKLFGTFLKQSNPDLNKQWDNSCREESIIRDQITKGITTDCRRYLMLFLDWDFTKCLLIQIIKK